MNDVNSQLHKLFINSNLLNMDEIISFIQKQNHIFIGLIANSCCGKNVLLFYIISKIIHLYNSVYIMTGSERSQYQNIAFYNRIFQIRNNNKKKNCESDIKFYLTSLINVFKNGDKNNKYLIIADDLGSRDGYSAFSEFITFVRHYNISIIFLSQHTKFLDQSIRTNIKFWFLKDPVSSQTILQNDFKIMKNTITEMFKYISNNYNGWILYNALKSTSGFFLIDTDFYKENFKTDKNNKSEFIKEYLSTQIPPKKIVEKMKEN